MTMGSCNGKSSGEEVPADAPTNQPSGNGTDQTEEAIQAAKGTEVVSEEGKTPSADDNRKLASQKSRSRRRGSVSAESGAYVKEQDEPTRVVEKSDEQKARIKVAVKACVLFSETDVEDIDKIIDAMEEKKVQSREVVIFEGQEGDYFYVIESGNFTAMKGGQPVFTYEGKGSFGELALMYNCPRAATVTADTDGVIWALDRMTFRKIIMTSNIKKRERFEKVLNNVECLKSMNEAEKSLIADVVTCTTYAKDERIFEAGDALGDEGKFYIIEQGEVKILDSSGNEETSLKSGDVFGHVELLDEGLEQRGTAAVVAANVTKVLVMQGDSFKRLIAEGNSHIFTPEAPISI